LVGARNVEQLKSNVAAAQLSLEPDVIKELSDLSAPLKASLGSNADMWNAGKNARYR